MVQLFFFLEDSLNSSIVARITECLKGDKFKWTSEADEAFEFLKKKVTGSNLNSTRHQQSA